jgi:hypothetical protein
MIIHYYAVLITTFCEHCDSVAADKSHYLFIWVSHKPPGAGVYRVFGTVSLGYDGPASKMPVRIFFCFWLHHTWP